MRHVLSLLINLMFVTSATCLGPGYKSALLSEMDYLLYRSPHISYSWGSTSVYDKHTSDCSGLFFAIGKRLGWGVSRTTAFEMEAGRGGWKNKSVKLEDAGETTIVWWTWPIPEGSKKVKRTHGHIGMLKINPKSGLIEVVHNNLSKGLHQEPLRGPLYDDISSIKDLTIGEKDAVKLGPGVKQIK